VRRQRRVRAQVGAHEQRIDHSGGGAGIGQPLVAPRRHARERERRPAEQARQPGDFLDVRCGVAANAGRIAAVDVVDQVAANLLALRTRETEVPRDRLEPVAPQRAGGEAVPQDGVHRVDQLPSGRDQANAPALVPLAGGETAAGGALTQSRRPDPRQRQRHPEPARAPIDKRQIEAVQVVILDHVRIGRPHVRDQAGDQLRLGRVGVAVRLEQRCRTGRVAHRDHEDAIAFGIEAGGLEIDLHAPKVVEGEVAEVGAAGGHEVLFLGRQREDALFAEVAQVRDRPSELPRRRVQDRRAQQPQAVGRHQVAQGARTVELAPRDAGIAGEAVEEVDEQPRPEARLVTNQRARGPGAPPDRRAAVAVGPDRHDPRRRIPAPQPFVFGCGGNARRHPDMLTRQSGTGPSA